MIAEKIKKLLPGQVRRYVSPGQYGLQMAKSYLRALVGEQRLIAVDVGAANGLLPHWNTLDGVASIYQIDPRDDACAALETMASASGDPKLYRVVRAAIAGSEGPRTLYVSNAPTGTSLFAPDFSAAADAGAYLSEDYFFPIVEQTIETRTLASIFDELGEFRADLVKLDIQGAELEALQGLGEDRLRDLLAVELEVGMAGIYPQAADFHSVQNFMLRQGFELFDVRVARSRLPYRGGRGTYQTDVFSTYENSPTISARAFEFDVVYFRKRSLVLVAGDAGKIRRLAAAYLTYNFFAEAHHLIESAEKLKLISNSEASSIQKLIIDIHRVREFRPWYANNAFWARMRSIGERIAPRSSPRWCQYMYQRYPSG